MSKRFGSGGGEHIHTMVTKLINETLASRKGILYDRSQTKFSFISCSFVQQIFSKSIFVIYSLFINFILFSQLFFILESGLYSSHLMLSSKGWWFFDVCSVICFCKVGLGTNM